MNSRECKQWIREEIVWCKKHRQPDDVTPEHRKGFIKGLRQALYLIREAEKIRMLGSPK